VNGDRGGRTAAKRRKQKKIGFGERISAYNERPQDTFQRGRKGLRTGKVGERSWGKI